MPIIIDKDKKRKDIAYSARELLLKKGIKNLTITDIVKAAGISRGSIYDYFETKEEIVFEIIINDLLAYQKNLEKNFQEKSSAREKIFYMYDFVLSNTQSIEEERNVYKEYLTVNLSSENEKMDLFNNECSQLLKEMFTKIIQDGIDNGELKEESIKLINGFLALEKGFLVLMWTEQRDTRKEFTEFLNTLLDLIEKDK